MSYNDVFSDSGLFYVHASSHPSYTRELVEAVTREFVAMAGAVDEMELIVINYFFCIDYSSLIVIKFYFERREPNRNWKLC